MFLLCGVVWGYLIKKVEYLNCYPIEIRGIVLKRVFLLNKYCFWLGVINYLLYNHKSIVMKKNVLILSALLFVLVALTERVSAQEWSTGVDIYSSYLWRGAKFGTGPAFQPSVEYSNGGFAIGAWGSYSGGTEEAAEADLYASYEFQLGEKSNLSFAVTDYYFPEAEFFAAESHSIEPAVTLGLGSVSLMAAYMEGLGKKELNPIGDVYFEAAYAVGAVNLKLGAGDGQYTSDGDFGVCNIMLETSKEVKLSEHFSLPVSGAVMLNPSTEAFHIAVGISL